MNVRRRNQHCMHERREMSALHEWEKGNISTIRMIGWRSHQGMNERKEMPALHEWEEGDVSIV
jgi:hypothetical protein